MRKGGQPVSLEPKALEVLVFLIENPGRLVEKGEILDAVWKGTVVTENAMTRVVADLRRALGDPAREARYIETVPTKGYRFIGNVREIPEEAETGGLPSAEPGKPFRRPGIPRAFWIAGGAALLLGLAGARMLRRSPAPAGASAPLPAQSRQVTDSLGLDLFPSFSPDGAQIAYCSDRGSGFEVFVRQLASGGREIQVTSDGQDNVQPAWSPDGRQIAYVSRGRGGIWLVPALGGSSHRLTASGSRPAWSPDGATLAFQSYGPSDASASSPAAGLPSSLFLVRAAGGRPVPLTRAGTPRGGHGAPAFSPDGRSVAFATWARGLGEIWTVSRRDGSVQRVLPRVNEKPGSLYFDPAYSPRGDRLYFAATSGALQNAGLFRVAIPRTGEPWGEPEQVVSAGPASVRQIAISPRGGEAIAYAALSGASNLWSLPLDARTALPAGEPVPLTRSAGCRNTLPTFSPDGSRIAFVSCRAGMTQNVWVMDQDGRNARQLTNDEAGVTNTGWFPDGERVGFQSIQDGTDALWSVAFTDRSTKRVIEIGDDVTSSRLSPDGRLLACTRQTLDGVVNVVLVPLDGGPRRQVTFDAEGAGYASWSPDGKQLAVELFRGPDMLIGVVPVPAGAPSEPATAGLPRPAEPAIVTTEKGLSWPFDWSPGGDKIVFAGKRDGLWNLFWISRRGGPERRLTAYSNRHSFVRYPAWSPRGGQIVFEYAETTGNIWLTDAPR